MLRAKPSLNFLVSRLLPLPRGLVQTLIALVGLLILVITFWGVSESSNRSHPPVLDHPDEIRFRHVVVCIDATRSMSGRNIRRAKQIIEDKIIPSCGVG